MLLSTLALQEPIFFEKIVNATTRQDQLYHMIYSSGRGKNHPQIVLTSCSVISGNWLNMLP
jgi:hypothetical protein